MAVLGGKDFFPKPSKVLDLATSWIATVSLKESFWVRVLLKRERDPLYSLTELAEMDNSKLRISEDGDLLSVHGQAKSKIGGTRK